MFIGVIVYCLVALRVTTDGGTRFVPGLTVTVAFALAVLALLMLLVFIHHVAQSTQAGEITRGIAAATVGAVDRLYPGDYGVPDPLADADALVDEWCRESTPAIVYPRCAGYVQAIDDIAGLTDDEEPRIELLVAPGNFVTSRHPLARVWSSRGDACAAAIRRAITVAAERDLEQDAGYGVRQLADIAVKALSPSINDPTTATTAIGYLQEIFERMAQRPWPARVRRLRERDVTLVMHADRFEEQLEALAQIGRYAGDARVVEALLHATLRIRDAAAEGGSGERADATAAAGLRIARRALRDAGLDDHERATVSRHRAGPAGGARRAACGGSDARLTGYVWGYSRLRTASTAVT